MKLAINLDKSNPTPVYYQLKEQLALLMRNESLPIGVQLPPEIALSEELGISRGTVRQAINILVAEGRLERARGKGTFVTRPTNKSQLHQSVSSLELDIQDGDKELHTEVLSRRLIPAKGRLTEKLNIATDDEVLYIERIAYKEGEPFMLIFSYLPYQLCPKLLDIDLANKSIYKSLAEEHGLQISRSLRSLEAATADEYEATKLQIAEGAAIHFLHNLSYLEDGRPIEYARMRIRGDRSQITFEINQNIEEGQA
jgi:GntR family transcriptional regulator